MFGRGDSYIGMDYVNCTGSESQLWGRCIHFTHYYGCSHSDDVGIRCKPGKLVLCIRESVDSLCRDETDAPMA